MTLIDYAKMRENDQRFTGRLERWLRKHDCIINSELIQHLKLYFIIVSFDEYIDSLDSAYSFLVDDGGSDPELFDFLRSRFTVQQKLLPSALMGNLFGMKNDKRKGLQLYRQYAFGRALMTKLPWLKLDENGRPLGPHVLLLSGSSWAEGCLEYHVNVPVKYLIEAEPWKREMLSRTEISELGIRDKVSGGGQKNREEHLRLVIQKSMDTIEAELNRQGKLLMIVNSYREAYAAAKFLNAHLKGSNITAACMVRQTDEPQLPDSCKVLRGEVGSFHKHEARILIAPAQAIERGYNIVDEKGHSSFGNVFFLVRPMAVPDEISSKCVKLNGFIEKKFLTKKSRGQYEKCREIRRSAALQWSFMEKQSGRSLAYLDHTMKTDITAGLFVLILQIFGRLARITDETREPPRLYFADGAFRRSPDQINGYDLLNELRRYLTQMMENSDSGEIAKTLYRPFYEAFMKGVNENVCTDIPDGAEAEDEYDI